MLKARRGVASSKRVLTKFVQYPNKGWSVPNDDGRNYKPVPHFSTTGMMVTSAR
jgi:hypothetical protein